MEKILKVKHLSKGTIFSIPGLDYELRLGDDMEYKTDELHELHLKIGTGKNSRRVSIKIGGVFQDAVSAYIGCDTETNLIITL